MKEFDGEVKKSLVKQWEDVLKRMRYISKWDRAFMGGTKGVHKPPADNSLRSK